MLLQLILQGRRWCSLRVNFLPFTQQFRNKTQELHLGLEELQCLYRDKLKPTQCIYHSTTLLLISSLLQSPTPVFSERTHRHSLSRTHTLYAHTTYTLVTWRWPARTSCNLPESPNRPKYTFTQETNQTVVQFDRARDHLFSSDRGLAVWSGPWSGGGFTPVILVWIKLKRLKVRTLQSRCERALGVLKNLR